MTRGVFISFEGGEGVGKSTQVELLAQRLRGAGREVLVLREPGSTPIGEQVRQILLDPANTDMDPTAELLLYEAARAQMVNTVVLPALQRGAVVLTDRFHDSTMAYQGFGRGLGQQVVRQANAIACGSLAIDCTILLQRDAQRAMSAATQQGADRMEREPSSFHGRVRQGFEAIAQQEPQRVRRVTVVEGDIEATHQLVWQQVQPLLEHRG